MASSGLNLKEDTETVRVKNHRAVDVNTVYTNVQRHETGRQCIEKQTVCEREPTTGWINSQMR